MVVVANAGVVKVPELPLVKPGEVHVVLLGDDQVITLVPPGETTGGVAKTVNVVFTGGMVTGGTVIELLQDLGL